MARGDRQRFARTGVEAVDRHAHDAEHFEQGRDGVAVLIEMRCRIGQGVGLAAAGPVRGEHREAIAPAQHQVDEIERRLRRLVQQQQQRALAGTAIVDQPSIDDDVVAGDDGHRRHPRAPGCRTGRIMAAAPTRVVAPSAPTRAAAACLRTRMPAARAASSCRTRAEAGAMRCDQTPARGRWRAEGRRRAR